MKMNQIVLCIGMIMAAIAYAGERDTLIVHNNTDATICVVYVKTKSGFGKNKYLTLYDSERQADQIAPGGAAYLTPYGRSKNLLAEFDRVLFVVKENDCQKVLNLTATTRPQGATALEVAGKLEVVIVKQGNSFKLKTWNTSLQKEIDAKQAASREAARKAGFSFERFKEATATQWAEFKRRFAEAYKKVKAGAKDAKRSLFGKSEKEGQGEIDVPMEAEQREGIRPALDIENK